jgi:hypothetical protein
MVGVYGCGLYAVKIAYNQVWEDLTVELRSDDLDIKKII